MALTVAEFLPDIELPSTGGIPVRLRPFAGSTSVLVTLHSAHCAGCQEYLNGLASSSTEFQAWDGRLLVVLPGRAAESLRIPFGKLLIDERRQIAAGTSASVIVADRYSQVFFCS